MFWENKLDTSDHPYIHIDFQLGEFDITFIYLYKLVDAYK